MTHVKFDYQKGELSMVVSGHALGGSGGNDPVCAGASTLAMTIAECVAQMNLDGKLKRPPEITIRSGDIRVRCKPSILWVPEALQLWRFGEIGFALMATNYPENVECESYVEPMED